jgi:hypothetical protein
MTYSDELATKKRQREYYRQNKERILARERKRLAENPTAFRSTRLKARYGISHADFQSLLSGQSGLCALCKTRAAVDVDHDHTTGNVRALLCRACNVGLGLFKDDPERLRAAIAYLEAPQTEISKLNQVDERRKGGDHHNARITDEQVRDMRQRHHDGSATCKSLAEEHSLTLGHVKDIVAGRSWKHLPILNSRVLVSGAPDD